MEMTINAEAASAVDPSALEILHRRAAEYRLAEARQKAVVEHTLALLERVDIKWSKA